ncbi:DUF4238 domain-containing protein [Streptacidiphilus sp. 4-A2]|nr:DUF4238 domain-containing protein [Streptacidiphilus sp. 4-A2]
MDTTLARISDLRAETLKPIHKQHLVSCVLLERFTEPTPAGLALYPFNLDKPDGRHPAKGVKGVGHMENFVAFASGSLEELWHETEMLMPPVFDAVDAGTALEDPAYVRLLQDLLALHLTRSRTYRQIHADSFLKAYRWSLTRLTGEMREDLRGAVLREHGLHIVGPGGLEYFAHRYMEPSVELFRTEALLRARIEEIYAETRREVGNAGLQIITPQHGDSEFLIGDNPAFTRGIGPQGPTIRVALGDASTAILPIGPRHLLALARKHEQIAVPREAVMEVNILQVLTAHDRVFMRPSSGLQDLVRRVCHRKRELAEQEADAS